MDRDELMGMIALIVSVGGTLIGIFNHKRLRSSCCGKKAEVSIDIENTTPNGHQAPPPPVAAAK